MEVVREYLERAKARSAMRPEDVRLIESIIRDIREKVKEHPWMSCHNDFHSHNIMLRCTSGEDSESLLAIDFEECNSRRSDVGSRLLGGQSRTRA